MALRTEPQWKEFLKTAGITNDAKLTTYSKGFVDNGCNEHSLTELDKDSLTEIGVDLLGHRLAILKLAAASKNQERTLPRPTTVAKASVTAHLTTLTLEMTSPQYRKFQQDWLVYKKITHLPTTELTAHLYNSCNEEVQMSLINTHPNFLELDETAALKAIEPIVTVRSNPAVHRKAFGEILQDENQSIKNFVVRLRSAATDCAFQCPNPACQHDLSPINIKDQFIRGLNNNTLQAEILAKTNQLKTLEDVISYAELFETALRDQLNLGNSNNQSSDTVFKFGQKGNKNNHHRKQHQLSKQECNGCGGERHNRILECKAWGKDCNNCGGPNHFGSVCRQDGPLKKSTEG